MDILRAIMEVSFHSRFLYNLLNKIMLNQTTKKEPMVDVASVLLENNLRMVKAEFFRQKKTIARVKDTKGNHFVLKTGRIEPFQIQLLQTAKSIEDEMSFKVPALVKQGKGWILLQEIEGKPLNDFYGEKPDWCVDVSKKIANDYQLVIQEIQKKQSLGNIIADGQKWLLSRLNMWSKPIVDAGLIDFSLVQQLKKEFENSVAQKGENFFGWAHGNIIGDHIIVSGEGNYLLDLNAVPRAGKGYYDFLRALDFMFLKTPDDENVFASIPKWIRQYLSKFDQAEVKLVFAFRNIGILGWDILHHKVEYTQGDLEKKKQLILKFIKREY